ncbi:MAG: oligosaccharide flippase family protein, partial [Planctomycetota bacterium]
MTAAPPTQREAESAAPTRGARSATHGAFWSFAGYGGSQVIRLGANLLLTRMLFREHYGLMAFTTVFMQGMQMFSDIGLGPNIVQNERGDDPRFLNTAWTMGVIRGFALWLIACIGAVPFAMAYRQPILALIIPLSGFTALLAGVNSTKLFSRVRDLDLKRFVSIDLASQIAGALTMIAWALVDRSVWALVAGGIVAAIVKCALSHLALPGEDNHFAWDASAASSIFRFGMWIFLSTILAFLDRQGHTLIFGQLIPIALLGVYSIATMLAQMPAMSLGHLCQNVLFPLFSRLRNRGEAVAPVFLRARFSLLVVSGWALAGFIGGGTTAIDLLYSEDFRGAGWMLSLLSIGSWFSILESTNGSALLSSGKANFVAASGAAKVIALVLLIPLGFHLGGFPGAVLACALTDFFKYAVSATAVASLGFSAWRKDLLLSGYVAATAGAGYLAASAIRHEQDGFGTIVLA